MSGEQPVPPGPVARLVPGVTMLRHYRRDDLRPDLLAAVTITALLIPSGLAYGALAGLSPVTGLYTGILGMLGFALFTTSRVLIVGPESQMAILVAAALAPLAVSGSDEYAALAAAMALVSAVVCIAAATVRLGFLADYLSQPVLVGYLTGVALIVLVNQTGKLVGTSASGETLVQMVTSLWTARGAADWPSAAVGAVTVAMILTARWISPKIPGALLAVVVLTAVSALLDLQDPGWPSWGTSPGGIPFPSFPDVGISDVLDLVPGALGLIVVVFADTVLTARAYALRAGGYRIDANAELRALGAANIGAGFFGGFPVGASGSRTAVNASTGGRTQLVGLAAAAMTAVFLLALTPLVHDLPSPVLAGVVVVAAAGLLRPRDFRALWRFRRFDFALAVITLLAVAVLGILPGIAVAVAVNMVEVIYRLSRPAADVLGPVEGSSRWRSVSPADAAAAEPGLLVLRYGGPLFFANAEYIVAHVRSQAQLRAGRLRWVVLDCEAIGLIDMNGAQALDQLADLAERDGFTFALARPTERLQDRLRRAGVLARFAGLLFDRVEDAVNAYRSHPDRDDDATREP